MRTSAPRRHFMTEPDRTLAWKERLRAVPCLYRLAYHLLEPRFDRDPQARGLIKPWPAVNLNVGSGVISYPGCLDLDRVPYANVRVAGDAVSLPVRTAAVDVLICENLLEHLADPHPVIEECLRVLKPGGVMYVLVPFIYGRHDAPGDYHRWTALGLSRLLSRLQEVEYGPAHGPTLAMTVILREWLAGLLSFGSSRLHHYWVVIFMVLLAPINYLDAILVRFPVATRIPQSVYVLGRKPDQA